MSPQYIHNNFFLHTNKQQHIKHYRFSPNTVILPFQILTHTTTLQKAGTSPSSRMDTGFKYPTSHIYLKPTSPKLMLRLENIHTSSHAQLKLQISLKSPYTVLQHNKIPHTHRLTSRLQTQG